MRKLLPPLKPPTYICSVVFTISREKICDGLFLLIPRDSFKPVSTRRCSISRVFVPLTKNSFNDFKGKKRYEIRRHERQWNEKNVRSGRNITLSCGYSGERIDGIIGDVIVGSLYRIFQHAPWPLVEPRAGSLYDAIEMNYDILGVVPEYIGFQVILPE